jgi:hypothetical protein
MRDRCFKDQNGRIIQYDDVRKAMLDEPYKMVLTPKDALYVENAVNKGIDSHLEACYVPELGDRYDVRKIFIKGKLGLTKLDCTVSPSSLPVLLRRLFEAGEERAEDLAQAILDSLGLGETC